MNPNFRELAGGKPILSISKSGLKEVSGGGGRGGLELRVLLNCLATPPLPTGANTSQILPNLYSTKFILRNLFEPPHNDSPPQRPPWGQKEVAVMGREGDNMTFFLKEHNMLIVLSSCLGYLL